MIAGGGTGIPVYRRLQKEGIPFATGILFENDTDFRVARSLASAVVSCPIWWTAGALVLVKLMKTQLEGKVLMTVFIVWLGLALFIAFMVGDAVAHALLYGFLISSMLLVPVLLIMKIITGIIRFIFK